MNMSPDSSVDGDDIESALLDQANLNLISSMSFAANDLAGFEEAAASAAIPTRPEPTAQPVAVARAAKPASCMKKKARFAATDTSVIKKPEVDNNNNNIDDDTDDESIDSDVSDEKPQALKQRKKSRLTTCSAMYDFDGTGELDEAQQAMRNKDKDNKGFLTQQEIYEIAREEIAAKRDVHAAKKAVGGLVCFVFILALSNLGTSFASAILAKETTADSASSTMKIKATGEIMGQQSAGETFDVDPLTDDQIASRRMMVIRELEEDPFHPHHSHRRLAKNKNNKNQKGKGNKDDLLFDNGLIAQATAEKLMVKCDGSKNVNIKRKWDDGTTDTVNLCKAGTSVVKKDKNKNSNVVQGVKGPKKKGKGKGREVIVSFGNKRDGRSVNLDCDGTNCYTSGTALLSSAGGPCNPANYHSDCDPGLQCLSTSITDRTGSCTRVSRSVLWYVDWNSKDINNENGQCVQDCASNAGGNCGGAAKYEDELYISAEDCCGLILSWKSFNLCVKDFNEYQLELKAVEEATFRTWREPIFKVQGECYGSGNDCFTKADEFACCSGKCAYGGCI